MSRDVLLFLEDMQTACEKVVRYAKNLKQKQFLKDEKTYDAVVRNLTIIGEAVKNIPQEIRELHPGILGDGHAEHAQTILNSLQMTTMDGRLE